MSGSSPSFSNQVLHLVCQFLKSNNSFKPTSLYGRSFLTQLRSLFAAVQQRGLTQALGCSRKDRE